MKENFFSSCSCSLNSSAPQKPATFKIEFTKEELIIYYKSIKNNSSIRDSFKLQIADAILNM